VQLHSQCVALLERPTNVTVTTEGSPLVIENREGQIYAGENSDGQIYAGENSDGQIYAGENSDSAGNGQILMEAEGQTDVLKCARLPCATR
jgi:hypothetical protein